MCHIQALGNNGSNVMLYRTETVSLYKLVPVSLNFVLKNIKITVYIKARAYSYTCSFWQPDCVTRLTLKVWVFVMIFALHVYTTDI